MLLKNLLESTSATLKGNDVVETGITGITVDSRLVNTGDLYIAIEGLREDGHKYISDAIAKGASAVAVSRAAVEEKRVEPEGLRIPLLICDDTRAAAAHLFAAWHNNPQKRMKMIGVTGTNGKTSVSRLIYEILNKADLPCGIVGTTGCRTNERELGIRKRDENANMTTPDPEELYAILSEMVKDGCEYAVMEVTSHSLNFSRVAPIVFDTAIFTNLTEDHLDLHGDMEHYFSAKAKLFKQSRRAIINYDDRYGRLLADNIKIPKTICSAEGRDVDRSAEDIHLLGERGIEYKLTSRDLRLRVRSPLSGSFNVMNTMQAAVAAYMLGAPVASIKETLAHFCGIGGRLERLKLGAAVDFSVYIDYAHTPDALENLLRTARGFLRDGQRLVLLFGCGGDREKQKRPLMGKLATAMADHVIITSDNSRSEESSDIIRDILSGIDGEYGASFAVIESRRDAIEYAVKNARRGDVIILAGKGHEEYELDKEGKKPFSERELVKEFVEKYYC